MKEQNQASRAADAHHTDAQKKVSSRPRTNDEYADAPMRDYPWHIRLFYGAVVLVVAFVSKLYWRWTVQGPNPFLRARLAQQDIDAVDTPSVMGRLIVANHASMLDPALVVILAYLGGSRIRPLYKSDLGNNKLFSWFFSRIGAIPLRRASADTKAIRRAVTALKRGEDVCIFPEGTRVRDVNADPKLHGGFALIAQMAGCEVVPIAIDGSENIAPTGKGFPRPAKVRIAYGEPVLPDQAKGTGRKERSASLERIAMGRVFELRAQLRAQHGIEVPPALARAARMGLADLAVDAAGNPDKAAGNPDRAVGNPNDAANNMNGTANNPNDTVSKV